jgi:hypothetical protein
MQRSAQKNYARAPGPYQLQNRHMRLLALVVTVAPLAVLAKPMESPTEAEAWASEAVVTAQYVDRDTSVVPTYFDGAITHYRVTAVHRGTLRVGDVIPLRYAFTDGSACLEPTGWKFKDKVMPAKGSAWVLFLRRTNDEWWTYRGTYGRWEATTENLKRVRALASAK